MVNIFQFFQRETREKETIAELPQKDVIDSRAVMVLWYLRRTISPKSQKTADRRR